MKKFFNLFLVITSFLVQETFSQSHPVASNDSALIKLLEGNERFRTFKPVHPNQSENTLATLSKGQHPFAVIVSCSDSRVAPEIIFDQGLGDLFIVRVAGNIIDNLALGSIEYAVEHLGVKLIVVLGHEKCGAVDATVKHAEAPGHIKYLVSQIKPAVAIAKTQQGDLLDNSVRENVKRVVKGLENSKPLLKELYEHGEIEITGARYDLDDGSVSIIKTK